MITLQNVSKRYINGHLVLDNVSVNLVAGEFYFLTGSSGAGKSTLLKLIAAFEQPTQGTIVVNNHPLQNIPARRIPFLRRQLGIISQQAELLTDRTIFENVALPLMVTGHSFHDSKPLVRAALHQVGLQNKACCHPKDLSHGEQQRAAIARAIINKPQILLADEPTGNLDSTLALDIMELFMQFNQTCMTILMASHDLTLLDSAKHQLLTLSEGKLS